MGGTCLSYLPVDMLEVLNGTAGLSAASCGRFRKDKCHKDTAQVAVAGRQQEGGAAAGRRG